MRWLDSITDSMDTNLSKHKDIGEESKIIYVNVNQISILLLVLISINNLRYADDTTLMAESEEELKSLLMKVKEESEEVGSKLNIQETKIVASGPITSWQINGGNSGNTGRLHFWEL